MTPRASLDAPRPTPTVYSLAERGTQTRVSSDPVRLWIGADTVELPADVAALPALRLRQLDTTEGRAAATAIERAILTHAVIGGLEPSTATTLLVALATFQPHERTRPIEQLRVALEREHGAH